VAANAPDPHQSWPLRPVLEEAMNGATNSVLDCVAMEAMERARVDLLEVMEQDSVAPTVFWTM
jgi:hypothetical protein